MPGYKVSPGTVQNSLFTKYQCPYCELLLRDPVQPSCGHRLCQSCFDVLLESLPECPRVSCKEDLRIGCFPDRAVCREIERMIVGCPHQEKGCKWEGKVVMLDVHLQTCNYLPEECKQCGQVLISDQIESHTQVCPKAEMKCPVAEFGCQYTHTEHEFMHNIEEVTGLNAPSIQDTHPHTKNPVSLEDHIDKKVVRYQQLDDLVRPKIHEEVERAYLIQLQKNNEEIRALSEALEKLTADLNKFGGKSNNDGSIVWKIPQFSQRMANTQTGRCTFIFSSPFYTGQYGYKMCLQLYILGDGIGKNTHMSLFLIVMKGDFDNILSWPFTHKVTFKLINQTGGRDITDTFQPDPMSSSFHKPKSDMNIASGCPRFVSHTELKNGGFILEDTVFIKCIVDIESLTSLF